MIRDAAPEFIDVLKDATSHALKAIAAIEAIAANPIEPGTRRYRTPVPPKQ